MVFFEGGPVMVFCRGPSHGFLTEGRMIGFLRGASHWFFEWGALGLLKRSPVIGFLNGAFLPGHGYFGAKAQSWIF